MVAPPPKRKMMLDLGNHRNYECHVMSLQHPLPLSLRALNLNLVPVLQTLLRERSVSRAAKALNLTQPSVSTALARLRELLDDPILIQNGRRMELTPRAKELIKPVETACAALQSIWEPLAFNPRTAERIFTIITSDYGAVLIGPQIISSLAQQAPFISVNFFNYCEEVILKLKSGDIDFLMLPRSVINGLVNFDLQITHLFFEEFVNVVGAKHALASQRRPTEAQIKACRQIVFSSIHVPHDIMFNTPAGAVREDFKSGREEGLIVARVEQMGVLPILAALTDCVVVMPRRLAELMQPFLPLRIVGKPLPALDVCLAWSPVHDSDLAHRWLRNLIKELFQQPAS